MRYDSKTFNYCRENTTLEQKLICTSEECAELTQACTK